VVREGARAAVVMAEPREGTAAKAVAPVAQAAQVVAKAVSLVAAAKEAEETEARRGEVQCMCPGRTIRAHCCR
jgi:hypothetical protein